MNARFQHPAARKGRGAPQPPPDEIIGSARRPVDSAGRACCCPAKAAVRVVIPPSPGRPRETDLLLCGHHYRVSRPALVRANATAYPLPGVPEDTAAWIGLEVPAPAA